MDIERLLRERGPVIEAAGMKALYMPAAAVDVTAVMQWVDRHAQDFGGAGAPRILAGDSAGAAHVAASMLLRERRACRLVGLSRDAYRHPPVTSPENQALSQSIKTIALQRRRFGYRRVHDLLRQQHPGVNHKRVYRLYRLAD